MMIVIRVGLELRTLAIERLLVYVFAESCGEERACMSASYRVKGLR